MTIEYHFDDTLLWSTRTGHAALLIGTSAGDEWRVSWCPNVLMTRETAHAALEFAEIVWTTDIAPTSRQMISDMTWRAVGLGFDREHAEALAGEDPPYEVPNSYDDAELPAILQRAQTYLTAI